MTFITFPLDDAYIVQHTVNGLLAGEETRYIGSSPIAGATSPFFVILILLVSYVVQVDLAQAIVTAAGLLLYGAGVFRFSKLSGLGTVLAGVVTAFALLFGHVLYQLLNGLETGLAMAAVVWVCVFFRHGYPSKKWHFSVLGVLPFIRPELGVLSLALLAYSLAMVRGSVDANRLALVAAFFVFLGALPVMLFLFWASGSIFPNTVSAKVYFFAEGCLPLQTKLLVVGSAFWRYGLFAGVGIMGVMGLVVSRLRWVGLSFVCVFVLAYVLRFPGALYHNHYRYMHLLFPFVVVGWVSLLVSTRPWVRRSASFVFLIACVMTLFSLPRVIADYAEGIKISRVELNGVAEWVAKNVPEDSPVLVHDAGMISLMGKQPLVDLVGLKTPSSVDIHKKYTWLYCGRVPQAIEEIALLNHTRYFVVLNDWDRVFRLVDSLRYVGWNVERLDGERGLTRYNVYRIDPPESSSIIPPASTNPPPGNPSSTHQ